MSVDTVQPLCKIVPNQKNCGIKNSKCTAHSNPLASKLKEMVGTKKKKILIFLI